MCNSWNHSYECQCGFGGEGHLGKNYGSTKVFESNFLNHRVSCENFVNPNAKCPSKKIKLPDAVTLASAKYVNADLLSDDWDDFQNIDSTVNVVNIDDLKQ